MQNMQKNMQNMSDHKTLQFYPKICKICNKYAKYVSQKLICRICTPHFADGRGAVNAGPRITVEPTVLTHQIQVRNSCSVIRYCGGRRRRDRALWGLVMTQSVGLRRHRASDQVTVPPPESSESQASWLPFWVAGSVRSYSESDNYLRPHDLDLPLHWPNTHHQGRHLVWTPNHLSFIFKYSSLCQRFERFNIS